MENPAEGLYEKLLTQQISVDLQNALAADLIHVRDVGPGEASRRIADTFRAYLEAALATVPKAERPELQLALANRLVEVVAGSVDSLDEDGDQLSPLMLTGIGKELPVRPQLPLSESGLYVNANRERSLDQALRLECESADRIDLICAFLFWTGYVRIRPVLRQFLEKGKSLRVLTTTYCAVTQARVLDELQEAGAELKVSYETGGTRLHAKS